MFLQLFSAVFTIYFVWKLWFRRKRETEPPELSGKLPLIGHGYKFLGDKKVVLETFRKMAEEIHEKGGVSSVYMGPWKIYVVTDPEDSLTISNTCLDKDYIYGFTKPLLGDGLVTSDATIWKKHRKLLNPAFNQAVLNSFVKTFDSQAKILVERFSENGSRPFDHEKLLRLVNLETICATAMGIGKEDEQYQDLQKQYVPLMAEFLETLAERFQKFWLHTNLTFHFSSLKKKQDRVVNDLLRFCNTILHNKKNEMKITTSQDDTSKTKPFLELILKLTNETGCFTDEEVRDEMNNIIVAGHDTSATVLTFTLVLLGSYPEVQEKVYREVAEIFENSDECDKDAISKLVYTEAVLKETMRLYPLAPIIARRIDKPVKLKTCTLEPNSGCFIFLGAMGLDPMWGPDRHEYRPERWLDPDTLPNLEHYSSFSLGRRSCIGKVYAMMSMKTTVAQVIRRYKISADVKKMVLKWDMMTRPETGHYITLVNRK